MTRGHPDLAVGVDVGGSKARLVSASWSRVSAPVSHDVTVPSATWHHDSPGGVAAAISQLVHEAVGDRARAVAVGAHGCNTVQQCGQLQAELQRALARPVLVVNDAELLLPAAGLSSGSALIVGTGSVAIGYGAAGELMLAGGWGGYIGDDGSATGLFRDATRKVAESFDRGENSDSLHDAVIRALGLAEPHEIPGALAEFRSPTAWAHLTPEVFGTALDRGSALANEIVQESARALADLVHVLSDRGADVSVVVAAGGVITNAEWMRNALRRQLATACPESELRILSAAPVAGALALANELISLLGDQLSTPQWPTLLSRRDRADHGLYAPLLLTD